MNRSKNEFMNLLKREVTKNKPAVAGKPDWFITGCPAGFSREFAERLFEILCV
jgi:hypothetical protein